MSPSVAIIMRSKNEMPYLASALDMLDRQTFPDFDFYAVDSGSNDGSTPLLKRYCKAGHFTQIDPKDYAPGRVLNTAISHTNAELIVLLNADAIPLSDHWLEKLIEPLRSKQADASFCRQDPRADAHAMVAYDYERAYASGKMEPSFFSAVACAFRRELWEQIPFRAFGYAEDLDWALNILQAGKSIHYIHEVAVEHSHNYSLVALYRKRYRQALTFQQQPRLSRQVYRCTREMVRDFLYAIRTGKPKTIPHNLMYRMAIHRGEYCGLKDGAAARKTLKA